MNSIFFKALKIIGSIAFFIGVPLCIIGFATATESQPTIHFIGWIGFIVSGTGLLLLIIYFAVNIFLSKNGTKIGMVFYVGIILIVAGIILASFVHFILGSVSIMAGVIVFLTKS